MIKNMACAAKYFQNLFKWTKANIIYKKSLSNRPEVLWQAEYHIPSPHHTDIYALIPEPESVTLCGKGTLKIFSNIKENKFLKIFSV